MMHAASVPVAMSLVKGVARRIQGTVLVLFHGSNHRPEFFAAVAQHFVLRFVDLEGSRLTSATIRQCGPHHCGRRRDTTVSTA